MQVAFSLQNQPPKQNLACDFIPKWAYQIKNLDLNSFKSKEEERINLFNGLKFFPGVTNLNLSHNILKDFPKDVLKLKYLERLDLSCNELSSLPDDLWEKVPGLKFLDVSFNRIKNLPASLSDVRKDFGEVKIVVDADFPIYNLSKDILSRITIVSVGLS